DGERIKVKQAIKHPKYNAGTTSYDFAILILEKPSKFPPVQVSFDTVALTHPEVSIWTRPAFLLRRRQKKLLSTSKRYLYVLTKHLSPHM
ncbi:hypothetical protein B5M09_012955, partial [Aphanomyces astaci]